MKRILLSLFVLFSLVLSGYSQLDVLIFKLNKNDSLPVINFSGNFAMQYQALDHSNSPDTFPANRLNNIVPGFNNAVGNFGATIKLYDGISSYIDLYLSSEHHTEMYMREGYIIIDKLTMFNSEWLNNLMKYVSIKAGQMEINYGDWHLRRSDNGNVQRNPLVGNYIIDANTTEIATELYLSFNSLMFMGGFSGGTTTGDISKGHGYGIYGKAAYDKTLLRDLRFRLSGSVYHVNQSANGAGFGVGTTNYLFSGNRSGGRYKGVMNMETEAGQIKPAAGQNVFAFQVNPYLQLGRIELFGLYERTKDSDINGSADGKPQEEWSQYGMDMVYRFGMNRKFYLAGRLNSVKEITGSVKDASVRRVQAGMGYFLTGSILLKGEYVSQNYSDFPVSSIFHEGKFNGAIIEASVTF